MSKKNIVVIAASMVVCSLFIGATVPSVLAGNVSDIHSKADIPEEPCIRCRALSEKSSNEPSCETCKEAVTFAVDYMKVYVKDKINGSYFLWMVDAAIIICDGLIKGFKESGYKIEINEEELKTYVEYWIDKTVGSQMFPITIFLAKLGAITVGITVYLLTLCSGGDTQNLTTNIQQIRPVSSGRARSNLLRVILYLVGLVY